ncbi:MAG: winged helix-turn-helix domain-containing protein [Blastocatellia bacterium]
MNNGHLYRFGAFALRADENVLHRNGRAVPLTPKMFDMLLVLVKRHGQIVDKDTLLSEVWPDSFVEEGNITFNIRQLRKVLDDDAQSPTYIETVPRRGYRFIAEVVEVKPELVSENGGSPSETQAGELTHHNFNRFLFPALAIILFLTVVSFIVVWSARNPGVESVPILSAPFSSEKLSTDGQVYHAVISSDGKNLVYTHRDGEGRQSIWLRQIESSTITQIIPSSDNFYGGLAISPDGSTVYFVRGSQTGPLTDVFRIPIYGGVPQKIIEGTQGWISISSDGRKISFVRCPYSDEDYCSLYIADSTDGKNEKRLVTRPRPIRIADNKISPDGKTIAFGVGQSRTASNEFSLMGVDIESGVERELTAQKFFITGYIAWLPDASGLLLTARTVPDRHGRIWRVSASTGEATILTTDSVSYSRMSMDSKATMLVSTQVDADFHLNVYQTAKSDANPRVLASAMNVVFAPSGRIVFSSLMSGNSEIWTVNADGSDLRQLTNVPTSDIAPMVSPDSKYIFFESDRTGTINIWRMNLDGTDQKQVTTHEGGFPLRISPDGQWLYYRSALQGSLRRVPVEGGQEEIVLNEMGRNLVVSPDATLIAFSERKEQEITLTVYSIVEQKPVKTFTVAAANLHHLTWSNDGDYLAYILTDDKREKAKLYFQMLEGGSPRQTADLSGDTVAELSAFALSADGKTFAVIKGNWKHDAVLIKGLK